MGLTLVRHTTPLVAPGTCYGRTDLDVASSFLEEAKVVAENLVRPTRIVTSPLQRCFRLAGFLSEALEAPLSVDDRLVEMDFGSWEGRLWAELPRDELDAWAADFLHARPHGGESVSLLRARTLEALNDHAAAGQSVLVVTHSGVIKAACAEGDAAGDFTTEVAFGGVLRWGR